MLSTVLTFGGGVLLGFFVIFAVHAELSWRRRPVKDKLPPIPPVWKK